MRFRFIVARVFPPMTANRANRPVVDVTGSVLGNVARHVALTLQVTAA